MEYHLNAPFAQEDLDKLKAGDMVYISGTIYVARDAAHKRMYEALQCGEELLRARLYIIWDPRLHGRDR